MDRPYDWLKVVIAILVTLVFWYVCQHGPA